MRTPSQPGDISKSSQPPVTSFQFTNGPVFSFQFFPCLRFGACNWKLLETGNWQLDTEGAAVCEPARVRVAYESTCFPDTEAETAMTTSVQPRETGQRLLSLDVARGITIAFMIMVNNN